MNPNIKNNCESDKEQEQITDPSNMTIFNLPKNFEWYKQKSFYSSLEPVQETGYLGINPESRTDKYDPNFLRVQAPPNTYIPQPVGWLELENGEQVFKNDPRLYHAGHGQWMALDTPPLTSSMTLLEIPHDPKLNRYGQNYRDYEDITEGQIMYYVDKSISRPFFEPNFTTTAEVRGRLYQDPMGAVKPQYHRIPIKQYNTVGSPRNNYEGGLSWIEDTTNHREDIMALQQIRNNQQKYIGFPHPKNF